MPAQIADFGIDKATIGMALVCSSTGYFIAASANGPLIDRFGVRRYVTGGVVVAVAAAALMALGPSFVLYAALQFVLGFGAGVVEAGLNTYLSTLDNATGLLNALHAFFGVGALVGPAIGATLLSRGFAWTAFFAVYALLFVPLLIGVLAWYPRSRPDVDAQAMARISTALTHRSVWYGAAFLILYAGIEIRVGNWSFTFLTEDRHLGVVLAGWAVSGYWFGLTAGRFTLSWLARRLRVGVVALIAACLVGTVGSALTVWLVPGGAIPGLALLGFCLGPMFPKMVALVPRLVPPTLVATVIGVITGASVGGGALFPWLAGAVAQHVGMWSLFPFVLLLAAPLGLTWWRIGVRLRSRPETPAPQRPAIAAS